MVSVGWPTFKNARSSGKAAVLGNGVEGTDPAEHY